MIFIVLMIAAGLFYLASMALEPLDIVITVVLRIFAALFVLAAFRPVLAIFGLGFRDDTRADRRTSSARQKNHGGAEISRKAQREIMTNYETARGQVKTNPHSASAKRNFVAASRAIERMRGTSEYFEEVNANIAKDPDYYLSDGG